MALLALVMLAAITQPAAGQAVDPNQQAFEAGMSAAARGDLASAIAILDGLGQRTDAPRVRLELARLLFIVGDYRRARSEFMKVYRRDLPYPVRRTINVYLNEIDHHIGFIEPQVRLVRDSNPTGAAPSGDYEILGAPLSYQSSARPMTGVNYRLDGMAPISRPAPRQWLLNGSLQGTEFPGAAADVALQSVALRREDHPSRSTTTLGWRWREQPSLRSSAPFFEYERRLIPRRDRQITLQAALELNRYPLRPDLAGETLSGSIDYARDLGGSTSGHVAAGAGWSSVQGGLLPRRTLIAQVGVSRSFRQADVVANLSLARASYDGIDPFFGRERRDDTQRLEVAVYRHAPVLGFFPGVVASYEHRGSTIEFFDYQRSGLSVDFRRRY